MSNLTMGTIEARFADIIWANEPVSSGQLVKLSEEELNWKKSTTYTVLRRLCERGLFQNNDGFVTSRISKEDYYAMQSEQFVEETFHGSLPGFLAAFTKRKRLSEQEISALETLIEQHRR
ncbi:MAG: BlaI/MecI/CopY family transcriptional regulator [Oscillospiraceae bacterium]|nr:BlaI/MecI/CopY family transcriptional regulator [Oscillospiraceae bacterium]